MTQPKTFAALIGMDWADEEHSYSLAVEGSNRVERGRLAHTPEALHDWAAQLHRRFAGKPVGILLEQKRGALVWALQEHPFLTLFPINPLTSAKLRQAFFPSGARATGPTATCCWIFCGITATACGPCRWMKWKLGFWSD